MLFRSLIDRLIGSNESIRDSRKSHQTREYTIYEKHPGLFDMARVILEESLGTSKASMSPANEGKQSVTADDTIFPVLELLRKAPPMSSESNRISPYVLSAAASSEWNIRDLASRTFAAVVGGSDLIHQIETPSSAGLMTSNALHGRLCCTLLTFLNSVDRAHDGTERSVHRGLQNSGTTHHQPKEGERDLLRGFSEHCMSFMEGNTAYAIKSCFLQNINAILWRDIFMIGTLCS